MEVCLLTKPIKEHVLNSFNLLNRMIDECNSKEIVHFKDIAEIQEYFKNCKVVLKRALIMSKKEIFNMDELDKLKIKIDLFEKKINTINERLN
jgi:hypothetical protein